MKKWMIKNMGETPTVEGYVEETDLSSLDSSANEKEDGYGSYDMDYQP